MISNNKLNCGLALLLLLCASLSLALGSSSVAVVQGLIDSLTQTPTAEAIIVGSIRLPRTLLALLVGACLGLSGAALQGFLKNPLADPSLIGASQGAALGAAGVFYYGFLAEWGYLAPTVAGLIGAAVAMLLMLLLAGASSPALVLLAGIAISTVSAAALATLLNFAPNPFAMQELVFWLLGSVANRSWEHVLILSVCLCGGGWLIWRQRAFLNALSLGESVAASLGFSFAHASRRLVCGAALLVGASVAIAGSIGFIGLLVPHLIRPLVAQRPDRSLIPSALAGALLLCCADILTRFSPVGREIKIGVITAILGSPLFIWFIWKERTRCLF